MKNSLQISLNKTLKLTNVVIRNVLPEELEQYQTTIQNMENYIRIKGNQPVGPLVQYTKSFVNDEGELDMVIKFMRQSTTYITHKEEDYNTKPVLRVPNCMYCRYIGSEDSLKFAYDKIGVTAFEKGIRLKGESYTVFVDNNEEEEYIVADVFMEREDG